MDKPDGFDVREGVQLGDLFRPLIWYRRLIWQGTLGAVLLAALLGGLYFVLQPTTWSVSLGFRPMFEGVKAGKYPNGLAFALSDIISPSVVEQVYSRNNVQQFCKLEVFRSGFSVQEHSPDLQFLNLDYQSRLSNQSLTPVERQRLQEEYASKRAAIESQYELAWLQPRDCRGIPKAIVYKMLPEILDAWATEGEERRGVAKLQIAVLSPNIFDGLEQEGDSLLVRADLLRTRVARVIANIREVEELPGSATVRGGEKKVSLAEIRGELQDIIQGRLDPLVATAGRGLGQDSLRWTRQALRSAMDQLHAAERKAEAYRNGLRDYTGVPLPLGGGAAEAGDKGRAPGELQGMMTQIDNSFIDRIVALSETNTKFRQEITRDAIKASCDVVRATSVVEYYQGLLEAIQSGGADRISADEIGQRLNAIAAQAKAATRDFNQTYEEFSRVSLRAGPAMFRIDRPADDTAVRAFGWRDYLFLLIGALLATPILLSAAFLVRYYVQRAIAGGPAEPVSRT